MITEKKVGLKPILESSEGIHLTAYLVNRADLIDLKLQLQQTLEEATEWLSPVLSSEEQGRFLEPLESLLNDARILEKMKGNIGIFRTKDSFRVLNIPVKVERQCYVATSFHVKPLLKWMQIDRDFLLLGLNEKSAHLYFGNQNNLQKIDSVIFSEYFKKRELLVYYRQLRKNQSNQIQQEEAFSWISEWIQELTQKSAPKLFIAGHKHLVERFLKSVQYQNILKTPIALDFNENQVHEISANIRLLLKNEAKKALDQALLEFRFADELNLTEKNIFQIAKAAAQGRIKKLIVADGINVFGKVNKTTGKLEIYPFDRDHEDDDILDDLAQAVLSSGGDVVIAERDEIPKGRPIVAILDHQGTELFQNSDYLDYEKIKERNLQ